MENTMTASLNGIKGIEINRDFVLKNCRIKTVSVSMNIGKLDNVPKRYHCDLAELVVIQLDVNGEAAMGVVNNDLMKSAGIEEDELFETARRNTVEKFVFLDFADVMGLFTETEHIMYMVTNEDCIYGAAAIMFPEYLKDVREDLARTSISFRQASMRSLSCGSLLEVRRNSENSCGVSMVIQE